MEKLVQAQSGPSIDSRSGRPVRLYSKLPAAAIGYLLGWALLLGSLAVPSGAAYAKPSDDNTKAKAHAYGRDASSYPSGKPAADEGGVAETGALANAAPVASFTYSVADLTISVDASGSTGTIVAYDWDFGDSMMGTGAMTSHAYAQPGTYTVTLTVTDNLSAMDSTAFVVTARAPNQPPVAAYTHALTLLAISVDAQPSFDPEGRIDEYMWDFGDGATATGLTASHSYTVGGTYNVTLTVADYQGAVDVMARAIAIPSAVFTYAATGLLLNVENQGQNPVIVSYRWTFGDGTTKFGASQSHLYAQPGTYTVTHKVTDNVGAMDTSVFIVVVRVPNQDPVAGFTFSVSSLTVDVSAQPSFDPEGRIDSYLWDFGDGTTATSVDAAHTYATGGNFTIQLIVSDYAGATDVSSVALELTAFEFTPPKHYHVNEGSTLNFSVTASLDEVPLTVSAFGLPATATFDGTNFSWLGEFEDTTDTGRHNMLFTAGGQVEAVTIGLTEFALLTFDMFLSPTVPVVGNVKIPEGGQTQVLAQAFFDNPFGDPSPIAGRGTNSWSNIRWFVSDTSVASIATSTNVAVINGVVPGPTQVKAQFTDADLGVQEAIAPLDVLAVTSISVDPATLSFPNGSTEVYTATATLEDMSLTQDIQFFWASSNESIATVTGGQQVFGTGNIGNVTGHGGGTATITAGVMNEAMVSGSATATIVAPVLDQALYATDRSTGTNRIMILDTLGGSTLLSNMLTPYTNGFGPVDSHTNNELLVSGFESGTGFSQIQRIFPIGGVAAVFTSDSTTPLGDTIDPQALRYRPDGWAYFAMSEGSQTLTRVDPFGSTSAIGGPNDPGTNEGFGPTAIAPFGSDLVFSGPWSFDLTQGQTVGFADLVARFDDGAGTNDSFVWAGFSFPRLAAPGGDLRILNITTGELFRFEDTNVDGDHFEIVGSSVKTAQDDPGERFPAGMLPSGFDTLNLDHATGDVITTRIVGNPPQRITVMRLDDVNANGVYEESEQTVVFDAGAPAGLDVGAVVLKY